MGRDSTLRDYRGLRATHDQGATRQSGELPTTRGLPWVGELPTVRGATPRFPDSGGTAVNRVYLLGFEVNMLFFSSKYDELTNFLCRDNLLNSNILHEIFKSFY